MNDIPSWHIIGEWFDNCSCAVPCPCTFAQAPDNGLTTASLPCAQNETATMQTPMLHPVLVE